MFKSIWICLACILHYTFKWHISIVAQFNPYFFLFLLTPGTWCRKKTDFFFFLTNGLQIVQYSIFCKLTCVKFRWVVYIMLCQHCHIVLCCIQARWFYSSLWAHFTTAEVSLKFISYYFMSNSMHWEDSLLQITPTDQQCFQSYISYISWTFLSCSKTVFWPQICFSTFTGCVAVGHLFLSICTKQFSLTAPMKD